MTGRHDGLISGTLPDGETGNLAYDRLILATGATPKMPPIPGVGPQGITTLQSMKDADFLRKVRDEGKIKKAVIIGGGLIGIETCEALELAGIEITVIELLPQLLTFLDWDLAKLVENHVRSKGANVITGNGIAEFLGENGRFTGVKLQWDRAALRAGRCGNRGEPKRDAGQGSRTHHWGDRRY